MDGGWLDGNMKNLDEDGTLLDGHFAWMGNVHSRYCRYRRNRNVRHRINKVMANKHMEKPH